MDNRPIAIFDSGVGGLTSINAVRKILPNESIVYFGDTARAPYGAKTPAIITQYSLQIADFLVKQGAKMLIIACNTITSVALDEIQKKYPDIPVQGIIGPAAKEIDRLCTSNNSIGIIGTNVTVRSRAYENALYAIRGNFNVHAQACPAFVPLIEEGSVETETMEVTVHRYLDSFIEMHHIDTLVLGCTHYPIIKNVISKLYPKIDIIDPSEALAYAAKETLSANGLLAEKKIQKDVFYASDLSADFINMMNRLGIDGDFSVDQHRF